MRPTLFFIAIFAIAAAAPASAQTLEQYLLQQARQAFAAANKCDERNQSMRSYPDFNDKVLDDHTGVMLGCRQPAPPKGTQLNAFERCARLYACTEYVYECARARVLRSGANTVEAEQAALNECRGQIGIPNG